MNKLYIVSQNKLELPDSPILFQLNPDSDTGDNISHKQNYSELRAHYWVWKNEPVSTDVVGFFQFRRYLDLASKSLKRSYYIKKLPQEKDFSLESIQGQDVVAPIPEYTGLTVWERYKSVHRIDDLALAIKIVKEMYPEYIEAADFYINGKSEYYCNLYIMRRDVFNSYCEWLFGILENYDVRAENIPARTHGYIAERLFGIWFTKLKCDGILRWKEVPRVHFWGYDDEKHHLRRDRLVNILLPPGSERRAMLKKAFMRREREI